MQNRRSLSSYFTTPRNATKCPQPNSPKIAGSSHKGAALELKLGLMRSTREGGFSQNCSPGRFQEGRGWTCAGCGDLSGEEGGEADLHPCASCMAQGRGSNSGICIFPQLKGSICHRKRDISQASCLLWLKSWATHLASQTP